jgi:hypothetical protein
MPDNIKKELEKLANLWGQTDENQLFLDALRISLEEIRLLKNELERIKEFVGYYQG